jgi:hypothetical protein
MELTPLACYASLGVVLVFTHGHINPTYVPGLVALQALFAVSLRGPSASEKRSAISEELFGSLLALVLIFFCFQLIFTNHLLYAKAKDSLASLSSLLEWLPVLALATFLALRGQKRAHGAKLVLLTLGATIVLLVVARILVLYASPEPSIDVFTRSREAVRHLLAGRNPYSQTYEDLYKGAYGPDYAPVFGYLPGYLLWATALGGSRDVRVCVIVAELITAGWLILILRKLRYELPIALLAVAVWLSFPIDLFVTEQAWIDVTMLMWIVAAGWALLGNRVLVAGIFLGIGCATKHYAALASLFAFVYVWRTHGRKGALKLAGAGAAACAALLLPFVIVDAHGFYEQTLKVFTTMAPRPDALSLPVYLAIKLYDGTPNDVGDIARVLGIVSLLCLGGLVFWMARKKTPSITDWLVAMGVGYGVTFLTAKMAFCNYYQFTSFFFLATALASHAALREAEAPSRPAEVDTAPKKRKAKAQAHGPS